MLENEDRFALFAVLFGLAMLFQLASVLWIAFNLTPPTDTGFVELMELILCLRLISAPSPQLLALTAVCQLTDFAISLPHMPNHRLITAAVSLSILFLFLRGVREREEFIRRLAPAVRLTVLIVYFFAAFHKINRDFLDPATSCSTPFFQHVLETLPFLPAQQFIYAALPWLTLLLEAALPVLLCFRRTRSLGIALAFVFHSILAFDVQKHFFDFTSTMFALLTTFLPGNFLAVLREKAAMRPLPSLRQARCIFTVWYSLSMFAALFHSTMAGTLIFFDGRQLLWWTTDALFAYLLFLGLCETKPGPLRFFPHDKFLLFVLSLLFLNGAGPYLGLKSRSALDMYSNLRIEGGSSNHYILRSTLDLFGNMKDLVRIRESSDPVLRDEYITPGLLMTFFEFRRYTSRHPEISVTYERGGALHTVARVGDDPELRERWPLLLEKLLWYRPVDPNPTARCQW